MLWRELLADNLSGLCRLGGRSLCRNRPEEGMELDGQLRFGKGYLLRNLAFGVTNFSDEVYCVWVGDVFLDGGVRNGVGLDYVQTSGADVGAIDETGLAEGVGDAIAFAKSCWLIVYGDSGKKLQ